MRHRIISSYNHCFSYSNRTQKSLSELVENHAKRKNIITSQKNRTKLFVINQNQFAQKAFYTTDMSSSKNIEEYGLDFTVTQQRSLPNKNNIEQKSEIPEEMEIIDRLHFLQETRNVTEIYRLFKRLPKNKLQPLLSHFIMALEFSRRFDLLRPMIAYAVSSNTILTQDAIRVVFSELRNLEALKWFYDIINQHQSPHVFHVEQMLNQLTLIESFELIPAILQDIDRYGLAKTTRIYAFIVTYHLANGEYDHAFQVYRTFKESELESNSFIFQVMFQTVRDAYFRLSEEHQEYKPYLKEFTQQLLDDMRHLREKPDGKLVDISIQVAYLFNLKNTTVERLSNAGAIPFDIYIATGQQHIRNYDLDAVRQQIIDMNNNSIPIPIKYWIFLLKEISSLPRQPGITRDFIELMLEHDITLNSYVQNLCLQCALKHDSPSTAISIYNFLSSEFPSCRPSPHFLRLIFPELEKRGLMKETLYLFDESVTYYGYKKVLKFSAPILHCVLEAYKHFGRYDELLRMARRQIRRDVCTFRSLKIAIETALHHGTERQINELLFFATNTPSVGGTLFSLTTDLFEQCSFETAWRLFAHAEKLLGKTNPKFLSKFSRFFFPYIVSSFAASSDPRLWSKALRLLENHPNMNTQNMPGKVLHFIGDSFKRQNNLPLGTKQKRANILYNMYKESNHVKFPSHLSEFASDASNLQTKN